MAQLYCRPLINTSPSPSPVNHKSSSLPQDNATLCWEQRGKDGGGGVEVEWDGKGRCSKAKMEKGWRVKEMRIKERDVIEEGE